MNSIFCFIRESNYFLIIETNENDEHTQKSTSDVYLKLKTSKLQINLELRPTNETSRLVAEIFAALDGNNF